MAVRGNWSHVTKYSFVPLLGTAFLLKSRHLSLRAMPGQPQRGQPCEIGEMVVEGVSLEVVCMRSRGQRFGGLAFVLFWLLASDLCVRADELNFSKEQIQHFLRTAKIVNIRHSSKGITDTLRLTLRDGTVTHDVSFQAIEDSHKYNIAAYRLAELLGLDEMLPVYVERKQARCLFPKNNRWKRRK